jgi:hypothetical protein
MIELLYEVKISNASNLKQSHGKFLDTLKKSTQRDWFWKSIAKVWKQNFSPLFSEVLTKWGICFNFNLMPADELLNINM